MLGIAEKAGSVQSGEFCTENAIKSGKAVGNDADPPRVRRQAVFHGDLAASLRGQIDMRHNSSSFSGSFGPVCRV